MGARSGQAPNWSREEFELLLASPSLTDDELAVRLPGRSVGAIRTIRAFVASFRRGGDISGLSRMMLDVLEREPGQI